MTDRARHRPVRAGSARSRAIFLIAAVLFAATVWAYLPVLHGQFIQLDDPVYVTENYHVRGGLAISGLSWAFRTFQAGNWHPLTWLSHMADVSLWGLNPAGHHLTSLLVHAGNVLLLFLILRGATGGTWRSAAVAALFGVHPLGVESVAWISERKDVLCAFFGFLSLLAYIRYAVKRGRSIYLLSAVFLLLGLMSKPMLVTFPFLFLLMDFWPLERMKKWRGAPDQGGEESRKDSGPTRHGLMFLLWEKAPFFILVVFFSLITVSAQGHSGAISPIEEWSLSDRLSNAPVSYVRYLLKILWPDRLSVLYPLQPSLPAWQVLASFALIAMLTALVVFKARRLPFLFLGWFWFLGLLVPVIGLVQVGVQAMADRYTYLPKIGIFIMMVWGGERLLLRFGRRLKVGVVSMVLVIACLINATMNQAGYWQTNESLFVHALEVNPNNVLAHSQVGRERLKEKRFDEAMAHFREAQRLNPPGAEHIAMQGYVLAARGDKDGARKMFLDAIRQDPASPEGHIQLGFLLIMDGAYTKALGHLRKAVGLVPENPVAHNYLGFALERLGRYEEARRHFKKAVTLKPDYLEAEKNLQVVEKKLDK